MSSRCDKILMFKYIEEQYMKNKSNIKITPFKIIMLIVVIAILSYVIYYLFPIMKNIATPEGRIEFKETITSSEISGIFMIFGLQIAQIFLVILPGEPLEILAGMCYGSIGGTIFILVSVFITTTVIFYLVRRFKKKFVYEFFDKDKIDRIEKSKIFNNPKKIDLILIILFLIPGTPKDLLVYLGGLLPIKPLKFILISTLARFPSVISSTLAGSNIIQGNWKSIVLIYLITFALVILMFFLINIFDKNKETEEALKEIK